MNRKIETFKRWLMMQTSTNMLGISCQCIYCDVAFIAVCVCVV